MKRDIWYGRAYLTDKRSKVAVLSRESLAAPGAFAGTAAVRCDVAAPAITGATLLTIGLENVTFDRRQL